MQLLFEPNCVPTKVNTKKAISHRDIREVTEVFRVEMASLTKT